MEKEKLRLVNALMKAKNAYHRVLQEEGYHIEYGLGKDLKMGRGAIIDERKNPYEHRIVGYVTITTENNLPDNC